MRKKIPISNVFGWLHDYLKDQNQSFLKFFVLFGYPLETLHSQIFQKMLILVFEIILQPPEHTHLKLDFFSHFSSLCIILGIMRSLNGKL